ncbi:MAG: type II toxin-antitoxin system prevent-host-death family antitoxin [Acidaminobacter sp.]|uniref:type II toxin-antitoxin system prevent-host-death family antitoxin n=1 Tax=Acidaminobacter sp. TaxID=1872102 RepID=UPI00138425F5|nr:type II toxin-antitoxin system prevent-host-death family antitoxin [Acidaminobacter sp.]MZQ97330.1 type II toxin-antitoxin system prevent-host-death family antitoxin [Acidaminobacter sp.]
MIQIRPISDLRNKFTELEKIVKEGEPVYLTKNGYGSMVVMSLETFADLTNDIEMKLDEADKQAALDDTRYSHDDVFEQLRRHVNGK